MIKNRLYKLYLSTIVAVYTITVLTFFIVNSSEIHESLTEIQGMWSITIFILIMISFMLGMTLYSFQQWLKQDKLHLLDINFLFGLFF